MKRSLTILAALLISGSFAVEAKNCRKGIPCGNTCIAANKICRYNSYPDYSTTNKAKAKQAYANSANAQAGHLYSGSAMSKTATGTAGGETGLICFYSKAATINGKSGPMIGRRIVNVYVKGQSFRAERQAGEYLYSPLLTERSGGMLMKKDFSRTFAMESNLSSFAMSDGIAKTTEQWANCRRK